MPGAKPKKWLRRIPFFVSFFLSERAAGEENFLPLEPEAECFAPPNVLPPPKNSGRVGGAKHPDVTGRSAFRARKSAKLACG